MSCDRQAFADHNRDMSVSRSSSNALALIALAALLAVRIGPAAGAEGALVRPKDAAWIVTGSLNTPRTRHTATLLVDGRVLVVGGIGAYYADRGYSALGSAELYDPATQAWTPTGSLNAPRDDAAAILLRNGEVLVAGGWPSGNTAELYDPGNGTWSYTGSLAVDHLKPTMTLLRDGRVLLVGGTDNFDVVHTAEIYDPESGTWSVAPAPSYARSEHTATLLQDGTVLIDGGIVGDYDPDIEFAPPARSELYDAVSNRWSEVGAARIAFDTTATLLPNGNVLTAGGYGARSCGNGCGITTFGVAADLYDAGAKLWKPTGNLLAPRAGHTATLLRDGRVLVAGGDWKGGAFAETYDVASGVWSWAAPLNTPRSSHTATLLLDGSVLIAGGEIATGNGFVNTVIGSAELYSSASPPGTITAAFTGSWYDPAQSGQGLFIQVLDDTRLLAAWFTFDPSGTQQAWFVGVGTYSGNTATISAVDQPSGGRWIPNFDPSQVVHNAWGTLTLTFSDCNSGHVDFDSVRGYGKGGMDLTRLTQPADLSC